MSIVRVMEALQSTVELQGRWAIIGAVARNAWAPPRATTDLDLTVVADATTIAIITTVLERLSYAKAREQRTEAGDPLPDIVIFRRDEGDLRQVDLLVAKTPFEDEVLQRSDSILVESVNVRVATAEALVVYKLLADRPRDRDDIRAILRTQLRTSRTFDWKFVERWSEFWRIRDRLDRLRAEMLSS